MRNTSIRIRPFNVGGAFEIVLPNGKVILLDPFFSGNQFDCGKTRENITGADYIILSHTHFDHDIDVGYFVEKYDSKVFCGAMSAFELVKYHKIPYDNIFPVYPGQTFTLEDFTVSFYTTKHNPSGSRTYDPDHPIAERHGFFGHDGCDQLGSMESLDFLITTNNNFRILANSGRILWKEVFDVCRQQRPNVLLRQAGLRRGHGDLFGGEQVPPAELAELFVKFGAQIIFPFHHDVLVMRWGLEKTNAYMDEVATEVAKLDPGAMMVNPVAWKWYNIGMDVTAED